MNANTQRLFVAGPAGQIECAVDLPAMPPAGASGTAVICHPHPQHGGTMDNKVVQTIARAVLQLGWRSVRFNFRGIGASQGGWDDGVDWIRQGNPEREPSWSSAAYMTGWNDSVKAIAKARRSRACGEGMPVAS